ncbi:MAG: hypothetical protein GX117_10925 [Candidatus Hydrogenedentes bacterium]|nr:hypothetical protein [Candidatus Hydrogenedentota bacterium]
MTIQIIKSFHIEAAYKAYEADGSYRFKGNSYRIDLVAEGEIDPSNGWVVDYAELKQYFEPIRSALDHCCLSDIPGLEEDCSVESLEAWIHENLQSPRPRWFREVRVFPPEPSAFYVEKIPEEALSRLPERYRFRFAAAQSLPHLPEDHPCRVVHGHSYTVEFACSDTTGIEAAAHALFHELHDRYLNEVEDLEQSTAERVVLWIWRFLKEGHLHPIVVGVQETPNNRCYYYGP